MKIEVLYFDGCPNHKPAIERVQEVLREEAISAELLEVNVREFANAQELRFLGSPSVRINGLDVEPEARDARAPGMMCRTYAANGRREGLPPHEMLRQAIREANSGVSNSTSASQVKESDIVVRSCLGLTGVLRNSVGRLRIESGRKGSWKDGRKNDVLEHN